MSDIQTCTQIVISNKCFEASYGSFLKTVDFHNNDWQNNNMTKAFYGNTNITTVYNISRNVTNMSEAFRSCSNLVSLPTLPASLTDMSYMCTTCLNFGASMPTIPGSVTNMSWAFSACKKMTQLPTIPNSVTDMSYAFAVGGTVPTSVGNIGTGVTNMYMAYGSTLQQFTGNIYIHSAVVTDATDFITSSYMSTYPVKNVYIPFRYSNGVYTKTYNAMNAAGYLKTGGQYGVVIKDLSTVS